LNDSLDSGGVAYVRACVVCLAQAESTLCAGNNFFTCRYQSMPWRGQGLLRH